MSTCIRAGAMFKRHVWRKGSLACVKCGYVKGIFSDAEGTLAEGQHEQAHVETTETQQVADDITHNENETAMSDWLDEKLGLTPPINKDTL